MRFVTKVCVVRHCLLIGAAAIVSSLGCSSEPQKTAAPPPLMTDTAETPPPAGGSLGGMPQGPAGPTSPGPQSSGGSSGSPMPQPMPDPDPDPDPDPSAPTGGTGGAPPQPPPPAVDAGPDVEPPKGRMKVLAYSWIGDRRITGAAPKCSDDGMNCSYPQDKTAQGYEHATIGRGNQLLKDLAAEHDFDVVIYEGNKRDDVGDEFTGENLFQYDVIVFNNPNGLAMNADQRAAFKSYVQQGGGYAGIHAGINCEKNWEWFHNFVGAFETGVVNTSSAELNVTSDISTDHLPATWRRNDEWHTHSRRADTQPGVKVLLSRGDHPIAWYQEFDGGRMWYTGLGHTNESFGDPNFAKHVWGGIEWAAGRD